MRRVFILLPVFFLFPYTEMTSARSGYITIYKDSKDSVVTFNLPDYQTEFITAEGEHYIRLIKQEYKTTTDVGSLGFLSINLSLSLNATIPVIQIININYEEVITFSNKINHFQMPWEKS